MASSPELVMPKSSLFKPSGKKASASNHVLYTVAASTPKMDDDPDERIEDVPDEGETSTSDPSTCEMFELGLWGVTLNIHSNKKMNGKRWGDYMQSSQKDILTRLFLSCVKKFNIELHKLVYEVAPASKNIHLHAMVTQSAYDDAEMADFFDKRCNVNNKQTIIPWRHLKTELIWDEQGWIKYIMKDQ